MVQMEDRTTRKKGEPARNYAQNYLLDAIETMKFEPGQQLNEAALSATLGISRTPIREAILDLADRHLIDILPQRGIYVSKINEQLCQQIVELRYITEVNVIQRLCRAETFNKLVPHELLVRQEYYLQTDPIRFVALDGELHKSLFEASNFNYAYECIERIQPIITRLRHISYNLNTSQRTLQRTLMEHKMLLDAIEHQDEARALDIITKHIYVSLDELKQLRHEHPDYF